MLLDARCWDARNLGNTLKDSVGSEALNYLYVPLGKVANTEIKRFLWSTHVQKQLYDQPLPDDYYAVHNWRGTKSTGKSPSPWRCYRPGELSNFLGDFETHFTFSVVRNPYTRLLSGYMDKIEKFRNLGEEIARKRKLPSLPRDFGEFVDVVASQSDREVDVHWVSQSYRLCLPFLKFKFLGLFEQLPDAMTTIASELGVPFENLPHNPKHQTGADARVEEFYDEAIAQKVYLRYRQDFEYFGYSADYRVRESLGMSSLNEGLPYTAALGTMTSAMKVDRALAAAMVPELHRLAKGRNDRLILADRAGGYVV